MYQRESARDSGLCLPDAAQQTRKRTLAPGRGYDRRGSFCRMAALHDRELLQLGPQRLNVECALAKIGGNRNPCLSGTDADQRLLQGIEAHRHRGLPVLAVESPCHLISRCRDGGRLCQQRAKLLLTARRFSLLRYRRRGGRELSVCRSPSPLRHSFLLSWCGSGHTPIRM